MDGAAELLGWTPSALAEIERLRGWTEAAIERLELTYLEQERRVGIPVRDESCEELGELRYDPTGKRSPKMLAGGGVPRQLFPPPEMVADEELVGNVLWLLEGEPDTARAWSLGLAAIGVPGAGNWRAEWAARFAGRRWVVAVCFDCDQPGREHGPRAAADLVAAGVDVRLVELDPDRDDGYDLTDFAARATSPELRAGAANALQAIAAALDPYRPELPTTRPWRSVTWSTFRDQSPPAHRWLIDGLLPEGVLCFIAGPPKRGKTWVGIGTALALALGHPFAGDAERFSVPAARDVLYVALEGSATGLRTRIGALARGAGVDPDGNQLERLHMLYRPRPFNLAELATADWLVEEAVAVDAALIAIDVLRAAARFQENAAEDFARIRDHLEPLLAAGRTVQLLHHFGKLTETQKERSPGERMAGTGAMYGALDVGFLITRSEHGARELKVDVEARDFAAPEAIGLAIKGEGGGKHGGFRYDDEAQLVIDDRALDDLVARALELFDGDGEWRDGDTLGDELNVTGKTVVQAIAKDTKARKDAEQEPRIARWDRDGRELGVNPATGKTWSHNARPFGTPAMLAARSATGQTSLTDEAARSGPSTGPSTDETLLGPVGPSGPSTPTEAAGGLLGPTSGGNRATEQAADARSGATEQDGET